MLMTLTFVICSLLFSKWKYKIQYKDIRNVSSILDTLILNYGYEIIKQSNNSIEYLHLPKQYFLFNFITKSKYFPKVFTEMSILRIQYDGNVIKIEGMFYHIQRLLWKLKKHYI